MDELEHLTSQFYALQADYDELKHKVEKTKEYLEFKIHGSMELEDSTQDYTKETWDTIIFKKILAMLE